MECRVQVLCACTLATCVGRVATSFGGDDGIEQSIVNGTTAAVAADIIARLEEVFVSLGKGIMVVAPDLADVPVGFVEALQTGYRQPVYTATIAHLLASDPKTVAEQKDEAAGHENALPAPCRRPASHARPSLLPPPSRYVVLFKGPDDRLDDLADMSYAFWNVDVFYLIVCRVFDSAVRRAVYGLWRDLSIYK